MSSQSIDRLIARHRREGSVEDLMTRLCTDLLLEAAARVPVNVEILASYRGARVEVRDQPSAGLLTWDERSLVIRVRASDSDERRRFTVCHEICHTFFPDFRQTEHHRDDPHVERFDPREPEEYLCDLGAAELLLPREPFRWLLPDDFGIDDVIALAGHFHASIEATARRCGTLSGDPVTVVTLEPDDTASTLRVRWAVSTGMPTVPSGTEVASGARLTQIAELGQTDYTGPTGLGPDELRVEARWMPYERAGDAVGRAIVLVRP